MIDSRQISSHSVLSAPGGWYVSGISLPWQIAYMPTVQHGQELRRKSVARLSTLKTKAKRLGRQANTNFSWPGCKQECPITSSREEFFLKGTNNNQFLQRSTRHSAALSKLQSINVPQKKCTYTYTALLDTVKIQLPKLLQQNNKKKHFYVCFTVFCIFVLSFQATTFNRCNYFPPSTGRKISAIIKMSSTRKEESKILIPDFICYSRIDLYLTNYF